MIYKLISNQDWQQSQKLGYVLPSAEDTKFIHLCTQEQIDRIVAKYMAHEKQVVVLKIDPAKLQGKLVLEANPGGVNKYYHLYGSNIPLTAVISNYPYKKTTPNDN